MVVLWLALVAACFACKETEQQAAREVAGRVKDKTVEVAGDVKTKTVEVAGDVKDKTVELAGGAKDKLGVATDKVIEVAGDIADKAIATGHKAKSELGKVYKSEQDYDIAVEDATAEKAAEHAARLAQMPSVDIKGVKVGYEEDSKLSLRGTTYAKHFRASWKRGDKIVRVSFFTKSTMDAVAFVELLHKIVPAVETVLK
jgi:hypothetical protein